MKKLFLILAAAAVLFSCGHVMTVEEQTVSYVNKIMEAGNAGKHADVEKLAAEMGKWMQGLSQEEQAKAEKAMFKALFGVALGEEAKHEKDAFDQAADYARDAYNTAAEYLGKAYDKAAEYAGSAAEYTKGAYDKAVEVAEEAYEAIESIDLSELF